MLIKEGSRIIFLQDYSDFGLSGEAGIAMFSCSKTNNNKLIGDDL